MKEPKVDDKSDRNNATGALDVMKSPIGSYDDCMPNPGTSGKKGK